MQVAGGGGVGDQPELSDVGGLVGFGCDADGEETDALVLGVRHGGEYIGVPRVRDSVEEQNGHLDAAGFRLLHVDAGEVGDGVGDVGAVADVRDGSDLGLEVVGAPPLLEGLLYDHVAAVLQEGRAGAEAAAGLQPEALQPVHHVRREALLLGMVVFGALGAVDQKG